MRERLTASFIAITLAALLGAGLFRSVAADGEVRAAQTRSWVVVALVMLATYLILSGMVRRGSQTIDRQRAELDAQVQHLETLLAHNRDLHGRVQRAASRTVAVRGWRCSPAA